MRLNENAGHQPFAVLVVEDDQDDEQMTIGGLSESGFPLNVTVARDAAEAVELLRGDLKGTGLDTPPRLVLLDLKLPKVGGQEVLEALRDDPRTATIPVVCLTGSDGVADAVPTFGRCANSYVRKPIDDADYKSAVVRVAEYWLKLNFWPC